MVNPKLTFDPIPMVDSIPIVNSIYIWTQYPPHLVPFAIAFAVGI